MRPAERRWRPGPAVVAVVGTGVAAALVALVFLLRAGSTGGDNWPSRWELEKSDNGVLFQLLQDVAAGRSLNWTFSPQVYVFPELPVSSAAFVVAGGDLYRYYLLVAVLNGALLFLALLLLVSVLFRGQSMAARVVRAGVAFAPLVLLPLVGGSWLPAAHFAPTYYFGMYLAMFASPALFFVRGRVKRVLLGIGLALIIASNPLVLVFCGLPFTIALFGLGARRGVPAMVRPALGLAAVLALAAVVRLGLFSGLQGTSPLSYVNPALFEERMTGTTVFLVEQWADPATRVIFVTGAVLSLVCLAGAVLLLVALARHRVEPEARVLSAIYLGLMPIFGIACTAVLTILNQLYLWPLLIAPFVIVLLAVPANWSKRALGVAAAVFLVVTLATGAGTTLAGGQNYFGYRNSEARCLDSELAPGSVGYGTYFDARRLTLMSDEDIRLVPLSSDLRFRSWLTNLDYRTEFTGTFFYLNRASDERELDRETMLRFFGEPDRAISCDADHLIWVYDKPETIAKIATYFAGD